MSRNVFISFLGVAEYKPTQYTYGEFQLTSRFVQIATLSLLKQNFTPDDKVYIFTTDSSLVNWEDGYYHRFDDGKRIQTDRAKEGLDAALNALDLPCTHKKIRIENGESEAAIWETFSKIYNKLKKGDSVYIDITHGYRSLPLFALPLLNYAKFLKGIDVAGIYYGEYKGDKAPSPIRNLIDFSKLQDWTNNANIFLKTGNATGLTDQIKGSDYKNIKDGLQKFSEFILVNRGVDIYGGQTIVELSNNLQNDYNSEEPAHRALKPILKEIETEFANYEINSSLNGFHAASWCIKNGLIQQAVTLLEEFITSYAIEKIGGTEHLQDERFRMFVSAALSVKPDRFVFQKVPGFKHAELDDFYDSIIALNNYKELSTLVSKIKTSVRNDINHAGFRSNPGEFSRLKESTVKRYNELRKLLEKQDVKINSL